jgi:hypothetical protein
MKSILACAILLAASSTALAQCCCDHCGCQSQCQKVCRVVCEVVKVPKVTYDCECEEFCVPGPSVRSTVCDECGHKHHVYTPSCGKLRTRTKMIKNTDLVEKVVYKWVVENVCCGCVEKCAAAGGAVEPVAASRLPQTTGDVHPAAHAAALAPPTSSPKAEKTSADEPAKISLRRLIDPLVGRR